MGRSNAGKSALLQIIHLLCSNMAPPNGGSREVLTLNLDGIRHARTFRDLITRRALHGNLNISAVFADYNNTETKLLVTIQNIAGSSIISESQERIIKWKLNYGDQMFEASADNFELNCHYHVSGSEISNHKPHNIHH